MISALTHCTEVVESARKVVERYKILRERNADLLHDNEVLKDAAATNRARRIEVEKQLSEVEDQLSKVKGQLYKADRYLDLFGQEAEKMVDEAKSMHSEIGRLKRRRHER